MKIYQSEWLYYDSSIKSPFFTTSLNAQKWMENFLNKKQWYYNSIDIKIHEYELYENIEDKGDE
jgi:hypothetical protein